MSLSRPRQSEVEHLHIAVLAQHDILRFHIAMDDARLMRCLQGAGNLDRGVERFHHRYGSAFDPFSQSQPVNVFSGDERRRSFMIDFVDGENIGMV